jgi:hypothetical protein
MSAVSFSTAENNPTVSSCTGCRCLRKVKRYVAHVTSKHNDNRGVVRNGKWAKCSEQSVVQLSVERGYSVLLSALFLNGSV